jgi:tetratricopeptide (TPR) repeat protein
VSAAFLSGLALYSKGELEPAAARFREALRLDSEFFPAAFYLGTCYAAGGRDLEAVGAWQLALVTEGDAPFIYTLLGDALLRLREVDQALAILDDAAARWPENDEVQVRIGAALAMAGKRADALRKLETYLDKHPDDQERQFVALRLLYQARTDGKPIRSTNEDRALFTKWATAYTAANGPQLALVGQWQKAMSKELTQLEIQPQHQVGYPLRLTRLPPARSNLPAASGSDRGQTRVRPGSDPELQSLGGGGKH